MKPIDEELQRIAATLGEQNELLQRIAEGAHGSGEYWRVSIRISKHGNKR